MLKEPFHWYGCSLEQMFADVCFRSLKKTKKQRDIIQFGDKPLRRQKLLEIKTKKRTVCIVGPLICPLCLIEL